MARRIERELRGEFNEELLFLLGNELKRPLVNIAQLSEIGNRDQLIRIQAQKALNTIDNMLLYKQLVGGQASLDFRPVHVGSVIHEVMNMVEPQMKMKGCRVEMAIQGSLQPADIDRRLLAGALLGMWQALIDMVQSSGQIICSADKIHGGIRLSLMSREFQLDELNMARANTGSSQPMTGVSGAAVDLLTASSMLGLAGSKLTKSRRRGMSGIGMTLRPSRQMQLI